MNAPYMTGTIFAVSLEGQHMIDSSTFLSIDMTPADPQWQDLSPYHQSVLILWYGMVCRRLPELKVPSLYPFSLHQQFLWGPNPFKDEHIGEVLKACFLTLKIQYDGESIHYEVTLTGPLLENLGVLPAVLSDSHQIYIQLKNFS